MMVVNQLRVRGWSLVPSSNRYNLRRFSSSPHHPLLTKDASATRFTPSSKSISLLSTSPLTTSLSSPFLTTHRLRSQRDLVVHHLSIRSFSANLAATSKEVEIHAPQVDDLAVSSVLKNVGDIVQTDDVVLTVTFKRGTLEVLSPTNGVISWIAEPKSKVAAGSPICRVTVGAHPPSNSFSASSSSSSSSSSSRSNRLVALLLVIGALGLYGYYRIQQDEGLQRSAYFWRRAFPIYLRYRMLQWRLRLWPANSEEEEEALFNELHDKYAPIALQIILELKGFYIKIGQIGATRGDFVPSQYLDRLSILQDEVPAEDFETCIKQIIQSEYDRPLEDIFSLIDPFPLGAASIGQVHRAELKDGSEVVLKIQYPKVKALFEGDIKTIKRFCWLAQPAHLPLLDEIEKQFMTEFDYRAEATQLETVQKNLEPFFRDIVVPKPIKHLCTEKVLVMEYLRGEKLVTALKRLFSRMAVARGMTVDELRDEQRRLFEEGKEIPKGPSALKMRLYTIAVRTKEMFLNTSIFFTNIFRWIARRPLLPYAHQELPPNFAEILDKLLRVHAHEIFVDGYFNGDPHPGNILLLEDGRLGLIDYGQVKKLTKEQRIELAKLIVFISDEDVESTIEQFVSMGFETKNMDPYVLWASAVVFFDRDDREFTKGLNLQMFIEQLNATDPFVSMGDDYIMAGRTAMLMRGLGTLLRQPLRVASVWRPYAVRLLKEENVDIELAEDAVEDSYSSFDDE